MNEVEMQHDLEGVRVQIAELRRRIQAASSQLLAMRGVEAYLSSKLVTDRETNQDAEAKT